MSLLQQWQHAVQFIDEMDTAVLESPPNPRMKLVPTVWKGLRDVYKLYLQGETVMDDAKATLGKWVKHHKLDQVGINRHLTKEQAERFVSEIVESSQQGNL